MSDQPPRPQSPGGWLPPEAAGARPEVGGVQSPAHGQPDAPISQPGEQAVRRSHLRVIGFSLLSFGIYTLYWFYVTRKQISRELGTNDRAGLQTLGQIVPILNFFIAYWLWRDISRLRAGTGLSELPLGPYVAGNVIGSFFGLNWIVYILVLDKLNEYYDRTRGGRAEDAPITAGEIAVTLIGVVLVGGFIALAIIGAATSAAIL